MMICSLWNFAFYLKVTISLGTELKHHQRKNSSCINWLLWLVVQSFELITIHCTICISCKGEWGLGIFHFQDHFNGKSHFLCISPLNRKNYHCCQWMIPQKNIISDVMKFPKPSIFHCHEKRTNAIPLPWQIDHRSSLLSNWMKCRSSRQPSTWDS